LGFGYLAANNNEKFLLSTFDNKLERFVPKKGMRQVAAMYSYLNTKKPKGTTKFESALGKYKALIGSKSLVIIISDLLYNPKEIREVYSKNVVDEFEALGDDSYEIEKGAKKFIEWINSGKLEIRVYPDERVHAKLYVMTFDDNSADPGRVITGSSNFSQAGLAENLEFNVELHRPEDYNFAKKQFNELWGRSVNVSLEFVETINNKTWINDKITPFELYLKFLYEYLKEKIDLDKEELPKGYLPENFMDLEYQRCAVMDANSILEEYGGVFISDVVGLGKTFITTMLVKQLDGRTLVIAPPILLDENNPGSWRNVFDEFGIPQREFVSIGKLDEVIKRGTERFKNVVIDEAHRFRTESTQMHETLRRICRGKRVILVSATPLNNTPKDILNQIKLFQNAHKSTLPNPKVRDLEKYFNGLQKRLKGLDRQRDKEEYLKIIRENAEDIRENVLQYLMVRRTRSNIVKYYKKDLEKQKFRFPDVDDPTPVYYKFDKELDEIFTHTLELILKKFSYSRYTPMLYLKEELSLSENEKTYQRNMGKFMKILLLKRLESSFFAFKQSVDRFTYSYSKFIEEFKKGNVYVSKKHINKIFEFLEDEDEEAIQKLISEEKADKLSSKDFKPEFIHDLNSDLAILTEIKEMWSKVNHDPKLEKFIALLSKDKNLKNKVIIFTESKETASYLEDKLNPKFENKVLAFSSISSEATRDKIINNFDPNVKHKAEDIRILVSTEILSEGVNLNRSNVVINYDIPWNPVRMMQRVGRINRVAKNLPFDKIYTYNFFPAGPVDNEIKLKDAAEAKVKAFIEMLGNDARLLTDEEIKSHDLFRKINSKEVITGENEEDDVELRYLTFLRDIRDNDHALFERIKRLPKKSRTARLGTSTGLFTFFRKGKLRKIYWNSVGEVKEVDFFTAAEKLHAEKDDKPGKLEPEFYTLLEANKKTFEELFIKEETNVAGNRGQEARLVKLVKALLNNAKELSEEDKDYLQKVLRLLQEGSLPKPTIKNILNNTSKESSPLRILAVIKTGVHAEFFEDTFVSSANTSGPKEVILSEYFMMKDGKTANR
ncbi:helicase, partial [Candidatus Woesearchaeota archaeon]|nr:helicase [Candidatus Woesearchaeota archaeon]